MIPANSRPSRGRDQPYIARSLLDDADSCSYSQFFAGCVDQAGLVRAARPEAKLQPFVEGKALVPTVGPGDRSVRTRCGTGTGKLGRSHQAKT
jgi:hypothetical protein